jgi:hypothetical protein
MPAPMLPAIALVVCKVIFVGEPTDNDKMTGHRDTEWDVTSGRMLCRDLEIQLYNENPAAQLTPMAWQRAGMTLGSQHDAANPDKPWRFYKFTCPVPVVVDGEIKRWELRHDCGGDLDKIQCESESVI